MRMVVEMAEIAEISEIAEMPMVAWAHGPKILRVALVAYWDIGMGVGGAGKGPSPKHRFVALPQKLKNSSGSSLQT
jgi:hypothetical protein